MEVLRSQCGQEEEEGQEREDRGAASGLTLPWAASSCLGWAAVLTQVLGPGLLTWTLPPAPPGTPPAAGAERLPRTVSAATLRIFVL